MDATLTDEEQFLAESAARIAADLRKSAGPAAAWAALEAGGMVSMRAEGATASAVAVCVEAFAREVSPAPLVGALLAVELARLAGVEVPARTTVALTSALSSLGGPGDPGSVAFDALGATAALGLSDGSPALAPVEPGGLGGSADLSRVVVPVSGFVPAPGRLASEDLTRWQAFSLATVCSDMVGAMDGALAMAVEYAGQRRQFGKPIGAFQAVQHLCAEQYVSVEASRSVTYWASWAVDALPPADALRAATVAKAYVGRVARPVAEAVLQVYGGIGQTWECDAHRYLRRALFDRAVLGDEHEHEVAVGRMGRG